MPVVFTSIPEYQRTPQQQRRETTQGVATGVGAAGVTAQATTYASKQGVFAKFGNPLTKVKELLGFTTKTAKNLEKNSAEVTGLWNKFFKDMKLFSADAWARVSKFKEWKFIGPIVKSPVMKGATSVFGATMAFFVLVSGVQKAVDNGRLALNDMHRRIDRTA